jgi:NTE family protein
MKSVGIVLSGGGARGIAHLGILKALEEWGIRCTHISGTSVGAVLGALYAHGYHPDEILEIIMQARILRSMRPAWTLTGLLRLDGVRELLVRYLPGNRFEDLPIKLVVAATDLQAGKAVYFSEGELIPALLASSCVPAMFDPVKLDGRIYIDGGIMDNLPAQVIRDKVDFLIGLHCNPIVEDTQPKNFRTVLERTLLLAINGNTTTSKGFCDVLIEPPELGKVSTFEVNKARALADIGYQFAKANFSKSDFYRE